MSFPLPTRVELVNHAKEYKLFEAAQNLRADLCGLLNTASMVGYLQRDGGSPN
jgi:hypothetical protein